MITKQHIALFVAALVAVPAFAKEDCGTCKRTSLKPLDLSRSPTHEELIMSGQLGGNLAPTGPESLSSSDDRLSFGRAMDAWNRHDYKRAKVLLKQHAQQFVGSPWKAEAELHLGCESRFNGRYAEAEDYFTAIIAENAAKQGTPDGEVLHRAELRLAMLETMRGDFAAAKEKWAEILRTDSDRVRRDYARHWLYRVGLYEQNAQTVRRCGTEALSKLFAHMGAEQAARDVLALPANPDYGFRADELVSLARKHGVRLAGMRAEGTKKLPTPFLAHYDFKHFVAVTGRDDEGNVTLFDPILNHEITMTAEEFAREWSGVALVPQERRGLFAGLWNGLARLWRSEPKDAPQLLALSALKEFTGGCCGIENPNTDEGGNVPRVGGSRCDEGYGLSTWSFAPSSVNIYISDTPLWYEPAIGPAVAFTMSYNAIDADNNLPSFGPKWMFNYHSYAVETPAAGAGAVTVFMPDGRNDVYSPVAGTNTFTPPGRVFNQLVKLGTNQFSLTMPDGSIYRYGQPVGATNVQQALLTAIEDRHSNTVTLVYDGQPDPKLISVVDALAQTSRLFYAGSGLITNIVDPFGRGVTVVYSNGYVSTVRDMGGVESSYTFYTNGLQQGYVQSLRTDCGDVSFDYALADGAATGTWDRSTLTATYADGSKEILFYNGIAKSYFTDRNGHKTEFSVGIGSAFPYQGRINSAKYPDTTQASFQYNAALQVTNVTDEAGQSWGYAYNTQGRLTDLRMPTAYQLAFAYTNGGFDLARVTEAGSIALAVMTYTAQRDVATITNALNEAIRFGYDSYGRLTNAVDALNLETVMEYGPNSWLSGVTRAGITLATFQQDAVGRTTNSVGPENIPVAFSFDDLNRLTALKVATEQPYSWTYQTNSLLLEKHTDRSGRRTRLEYDELERVGRVWGPDSSFVSFEFDSADNPSALLDGRGNRTRFFYDTRDRLTQKTYPGGDSISVSYDARGLPVSHTGGRGIVTAFKYSNDGLLTNVAYTATNTPSVRYSYDSRNLLTSSADGWSTNSYGYDLLGRLTNLVEIGIAGTQRFFYAYDPLGRLTNLLWQSGTNSITNRFVYDSLGRVTNLVSDGGTYVYAYTNAGLQVSRLTYPNGEYAASLYDSLGRLTNLSFSTGGSWSYAFDSRDFVTRRVNPAGEVFTYKHDDAGRLTEAIGLSGTNVISGYPLRYQYDKAGNRVRQTEGQKQRDLLYDEDNQLLTSQRTNVLTVRGYVNEAGSRVEAKSNSATNWIPGTVRFISYTQSHFEVHGLLTTNIYPASNTVWVRAFDVSNNVSTSIVHTAYSATSKREYDYDADGNLVEFPALASTVTTNFVLTWDAENRMTAMQTRFQPTFTNSLILTNRIEFTYDSANRLRQVREYSTNGVLTSTVRYVWSGWQIVGELDGSNKLVRTFTHGVDLSGTIGGAGGIGGLVGIRSYVAPVTNYYVRGDGRGNVVEVRRFNGTTAASYGYYEFGGTRYQTNTYMQGFRWSTRLHHAPSGFMCFGARWFDPTTGRFLSRDPLQENGGINVYQALAANPVNTIDPDGRVVETIVDVASIGWSAADLWRHPSWGNAGFLAWDVGAAIVPFVPGSYVAKAAKLAGKAKKCSIVTQEAVQEGTKVYRVWGDEATAWGRSWSTVDPRTVPNYRNVAGLPNENTGRFVTEGVLQDTKGITLKSADPLNGNAGGLPEVVVPNPESQIKVQNVQGLNPEF